MLRGQAFGLAHTQKAGAEQPPYASYRLRIKKNAAEQSVFEEKNVIFFSSGPQLTQLGLQPKYVREERWKNSITFQ